jgi:hypothetical protein
MLLLWTAGVIFLFLACSARLGRARGFWTMAVFVLSPAWAVWSMKARGGYLTSFTAASALLWLLALDTARTEARWIAAGALTAVIYLAQPLWLPTVLPFAVAALWRDRQPSWAVSYVGMAVAPALILRAVSSPAVDSWKGPPFGNPDLMASLPAVARQIHANLTGSYYLGWMIDPPGPATEILAWIWCGLLIAVVVHQVCRLIAGRTTWSHLVLLGLCGTIVADWTFLRVRDARYLLPLSAPLVVLGGEAMAALIDRRLLPKRLVAGMTCALLVLGLLSMREFRQFAFLWTNPPNSLTEAARLQRLLDYVKSRGAMHVFSMNGLLSPQLIFYSNEEVLSRSTYLTDRYPPYVEAVDRALKDGRPIAVVGYTDDSGAPGCWNVPICTGGIATLIPDRESLFTVDGKYFAYVGADQELLRKLHFQLSD